MNYINQNIGLPKWIANKAMYAYFAALAIVTAMYFSRMLPWYYLLSGAVSVIAFFYGAQQLSRKWSAERIRSGKRFEKKVFLCSFMISASWTILLYYIFIQNYGDAFGFDNQDSNYYHEAGCFCADLISQGNFHFWDEIERFNGKKLDISDTGYAIYLGFIYFITDKSILIARLIKSLYFGWISVLIYRIGRRNFGEQTGRLAAILCVLWPSFWFYCSVHLKEIEMTTLCVLFVEQADLMLRTRNFSAWKVIPVLLIAAALFTFRTPLALVSVMALLFTIVMSSSKVVNWGKRFLIGLLAVGLISVTMGNRIQEEASGLLETVRSGQQKSNMEWRAERKDAAGFQNKFAKYAGATVFAPLIFTIPFPTMVSPFDGQDLQKLLNGSYYAKNVISGFVILAMFMLLLSGRWREHMLPLSFMLGYLVVLAFSNFAQSGRFHMPIMPLEMLFGAYGLQIVINGIPMTKHLGNRITYKKWISMWCIVCFVFALFWNWFKLAGRGVA